MYGSQQKVNGREGSTSFPPQQENNNTDHNVQFDCSINKLTQKERILTVKYGAHQMKLIRKRLAVEGWLDEQLRILYRCVS